MVPGFTGLTAGTEQTGPRLAGLWDTPPQERCRYARTDTFCTGLVLWCREVYVCADERSPLFGHEESKTPYPCGVCVGIDSPDDW
jgi:hypothetical protein